HQQGIAKQARRAVAHPLGPAKYSTAHRRHWRHYRIKSARCPGRRCNQCRHDSRTDESGRPAEPRPPHRCARGFLRGLEMTPVRTVADPGERALIQLISESACVGQQPDGTFGIGDDCAALPAAPANSSNTPAGETILTTDLLIENTHFLRNNETDWHRV